MKIKVFLASEHTVGQWSLLTTHKDGEVCTYGPFVSDAHANEFIARQKDKLLANCNTKLIPMYSAW